MAASNWAAALDHIVTVELRSIALAASGPDGNGDTSEKARNGREHPDLDGTLTASPCPAARR